MRSVQSQGERPPTGRRTRHNTKWYPIAALSFLAMGVAGTRAHAGQLATKSDAFLIAKASRRANWGGTKVIVRLDGPLAPAYEAELKALGADIYRRLPIVRSVAVSIPSDRLEKLAALPFVTRLSTDFAVKKNDEFTSEGSGAGTAFKQYGLTGRGVTVAVLDSGIKPCFDLLSTADYSSRVVGNVSFVNDGFGADDRCGHGTHVAGIIGGNGLASSGLLFTRTFYGVARKVKLVNVRVLDTYGRGDVSSTIEGIQWVINNRSAYNIRILNLSLGHPVGESYTTDPLCQAVEAAWKAGIVVVCAAGNDGRSQIDKSENQENEGYGAAYGSIQSPANSPYCITVGAMKSRNGNRAYDRIATYSSRGPSRLDMVLKPDLVAPGNQVISTLAYGSYLDKTHSETNLVPWQSYSILPIQGSSWTYFKMSGTSMAAPVVSGAAALLLEANPSLTPDTIKARLMMTADKWADPSGRMDPCTYGAGYLNIMAALRSTAVATKHAISPRLIKDDDGKVRFDMQQILWGTQLIWGMPDTVPDAQIVWGNNVLWGTNVLWGSQILWGQMLWDDKILWGEYTGKVDLSSTAIRGD